MSNSLLAEISNPKIPVTQPEMYVVFGQEQDGFGSDYQVEQSFSGDMAGISFWTKALMASDIASWPLAKSQPLMEMCWILTTFPSKDVVQTEMNLEDFCKKDLLRNVLLWAQGHFLQRIQGLL